MSGIENMFVKCKISKYTVHTDTSRKLHVFNPTKVRGRNQEVWTSRRAGSLKLERPRRTASGIETEGYETREILKQYWLNQDQNTNLDVLVTNTLELAAKVQLDVGSFVSPAEVAARVAAVAPLLGLSMRECLQALILSPRLAVTPNGQLITAMMQLQSVLPRSVDPSQIAKLTPQLLCMAGLPMVASNSLEALREILPEACVVWLIQEEPDLLLEVNQTRISQLMETAEQQSECIREIREYGPGAEDNVHWRMWFQNVFVDYY
mmetsp:Transcript_35972/g.49937  ORF Transcript_35972/g.49937 Transcript_35972/m.49937 type:complete len:264 (-) Transcript_35972:108-899(-)